MTVKVEAINIDTLPAAEAAAIRAAEAEAEAFYQNIADEENEQARIVELRTVCLLIIKNAKAVAEAVVAAHLMNDELFTDSEKENLILAASNINSEDHHAVMRTYRLTRAANNLFLARNSYNHSVTTAELIQRVNPVVTPAAVTRKKRFLFF